MHPVIRWLMTDARRGVAVEQEIFVPDRTG